MADFNKLRAKKASSTVFDPVDIFRRLPKPPGINDIYTSQAEVLTAWFGRRDEKDLVLKLHTGGGKTLVGLLIGQSTLNEKREPVVYLSPTNQLVDQTLAKAAEYGIPAVPYITGPGAEFQDEFLSGQSLLVANYHAMFNGLSRFGTRGGNRQLQHAAAIILDDAHAAFSTVRDQYTLSVKSDKNKDDYAHLTNLFRNDFREIDRLGSFDDVVTGEDFAVLEVPHWAWKEKLVQVQQYLKEHQASYKLPWLFLRDSLAHCHCLIGRSALVITPYYPLVDAIPTFSDCPRRVYMSATIGDDSALIRTFDADADSVGKPISSKSLAGISERMILAPELMNLKADVKEVVPKVAKWVVDSKKAGTVILVPSQHATEQWKDIAEVPEKTDEVAEAVRRLQLGETHGPIVFANRYDGIDLPGNSCRLLIFSGLPKGMSEYDMYRANVFAGGSAINSELAQRIEQGIGRGARGANDYCVVIITGKDLIGWISKTANLRFLTSSTRAQLEMGADISKSVKSGKDMAETIEQCLTRAKEWTQYHAETLADAVGNTAADAASLEQAALERRAFNWMRDGHFEKAISKLRSYCERQGALDQKTRGWLLQLAAAAANQWDQADVALKLQQQAFAANRSLPRPKVAATYEPLVLPGPQAQAIVRHLKQFNNRRGCLADFDELVSHLVREASANQFEQALAELAEFLGFVGERPEQSDPKGPDVLWLLSDKVGLVIEAKSRKKPGNSFTKDQQGQLLHGAEWFQSKYPGLQCVRASVHPNAVVSRSTVPGETKALTFDKLNQLTADARVFLDELCQAQVDDEQLVLRCQQMLSKSKLTPKSLIGEYLVPFRDS